MTFFVPHEHVSLTGKLEIMEKPPACIYMVPFKVVSHVV